MNVYRFQGLTLPISSFNLKANSNLKNDFFYIYLQKKSIPFVLHLQFVLMLVNSSPFFLSIYPTCKQLVGTFIETEKIYVWLRPNHSGSMPQPFFFFESVRDINMMPFNSKYLFLAVSLAAFNCVQQSIKQSYVN